MVLQLLGMMAAMIAASIATALLGQWLTGQTMESMTEQMLKLYVATLPLMIVTQLLSMIPVMFMWRWY